MSTATTPAPDLPIPAGARAVSTFEEWSGEFRIIEGVGRAIVPTGLIVTAVAHELPDGQVCTDADAVQFFLGDPQSWRKPKPR